MYVQIQYFKHSTIMNNCDHSIVLLVILVVSIFWLLNLFSYFLVKKHLLLFYYHITTKKNFVVHLHNKFLSPQVTTIISNKIVSTRGYLRDCMSVYTLNIYWSKNSNTPIKNFFNFFTLFTLTFGSSHHVCTSSLDSSRVWPVMFSSQCFSHSFKKKR